MQTVGVCWILYGEDEEKEGRLANGPRFDVQVHLCLTPFSSVHFRFMSILLFHFFLDFLGYSDFYCLFLLTNTVHFSYME